MEQRVQDFKKSEKFPEMDTLKESLQKEFRAETEEEKYGSLSTDYQFVEVPFVIQTTDI